MFKAIPNVVDVKTVRGRALEENFAQAKAFLETLPKDTLLIMMIGWDDPVKNYPLAVAAAEILLASGPSTAFAFVGPDPNRSDLQHLLKSYSGRILLIRDAENPLPLLRACGVLLMTSKKEGSPLAVLEAFALGKPVVGTNVGGINDLVKDDVNGILCNESPDAIAKAIARINSDEKLLSSLSAGAGRSGDALDLTSWCDAYAETYCGMCG
jgi:glycosyltransferase involved in cell wall biosynthesis